MHHQHATSQDFYCQFVTSFQQIMTSVQVVGFLMQRLNLEVWTNGYLEDFSMFQYLPFMALDIFPFTSSLVLLNSDLAYNYNGRIEIYYAYDITKAKA